MIHAFCPPCLAVIAAASVCGGGFVLCSAGTVQSPSDGKYNISGLIMQTVWMRHRPGKPGLTAAAIFNTIIFMNGNAFPAGDREDRKAGVGPT
jgi:hypothetical protein